MRCSAFRWSHASEPPTDPARAVRPPQAGAERRELSACEYVERETLEEQSRYEGQRREGGSTVTERTELREARTQERRDFATLAVRQTVSYLDALHVEEQLVHAYCEQVGSVYDRNRIEVAAPPAQQHARCEQAAGARLLRAGTSQCRSGLPMHTRHTFTPTASRPQVRV